MITQEIYKILVRMIQHTKKLVTEPQNKSRFFAVLKPIKCNLAQPFNNKYIP